MNVYVWTNSLKNAYIGEYGRNLNNWQLSQTSSALSWTWWTWVHMKEDWTKMYLSKGRYIYEYNLSSPFNIASYTNVNSLYSNIENGSVESIRLNPQWTKLYVMHSYYIVQYTLSTPRNLSTAVQNYSTYITAESGNIRWISFNDTWTKIFISSWNANKLYEASLSTPWDLSSIWTLSTKTWWQWLDSRWWDNGNIYVWQKWESSSYLSFSYCSTPYDITTITNTVDKNIGVCNWLWVWFNSSWTIWILVWWWNNTNYIRKYILK
jgi:hypothetical protein